MSRESYLGLMQIGILIQVQISKLVKSCYKPHQCYPLVAKNQKIRFPSYGLKGQGSMTFDKFGYVESKIKNCQIFRILCFTLETLHFVSKNSKYRYAFEKNVLLCFVSPTVVSRESHFLQATAQKTED